MDLEREDTGLQDLSASSPIVIAVVCFHLRVQNEHRNTISCVTQKKGTPIVVAFANGSFSCKLKAQRLAHNCEPFHYRLVPLDLRLFGE